ncbi:hypothetical protein CF319_g4214 [Tilletia indica]|nr:hypothetical protein CF319_g4214 [Tilletia indica]
MDHIGFGSSSEGLLTRTGTVVTENSFVNAFQEWNNTSQWDYSGPTASQQCIAILAPQVRDSVSAAYRALRVWAVAGKRPNFEELRSKYLLTCDPRAQDVILSELAKFFDSAEVDMMLRPAHPTGASLTESTAVTHSGVPTREESSSSPSFATPLSLSSTATSSGCLPLTARATGAAPGADLSTTLPSVTDTPAPESPSLPVAALAPSTRHNLASPAASLPMKTRRKKSAPYEKESGRDTNMSLASAQGSSSTASSRRGLVGMCRSTSISVAVQAALSVARPPEPSFAALSRPTRKALAAARAGATAIWRYMGVVKWNEGAIDGEPLSNSEVLVEGRKAALPSPDSDRAMRLAHLRESWMCHLCGAMRYELVGRTSNLSKHVRESHQMDIQTAQRSANIVY